MHIHIKCRLGLLVLPKTYAYFASYASQVSALITHNQGMHDIDIFIRGGIFGAGRPTIVLNALAPPPLNSAVAFFHCAIWGDSFPRGSVKFSWISLGGIHFLTEVLDNRSDLKFLHFANVSHSPLLKVLYISNQALPHAFHTPSVIQLD